jgi:hypothetical protein
MEIKDILFYFLAAAVAFPWAVYEGYNVISYVQTLKSEHGDCYHTNPQLLSLFLYTQLILIGFMIPIQTFSKKIVMRLLPAGKFPIGSKLRDYKADNVSEKIFRLFVYTTLSAMDHHILKQSNFLDKQLGGTVDEP